MLRDAADELTAHQRVQLGIFVDRLVNPEKKATSFQIGEMRLEVEADRAVLRCHEKRPSLFGANGSPW